MVRMNDKKLPYSGTEWEACKKWFNKNVSDSGQDCVDMLFDDMYIAWDAALRWKETYQAPTFDVEKYYTDEDVD